MSEEEEATNVRRAVRALTDEWLNALISEAADNFGWRLAEAAITTERVDAVPGTSPPLPGVRYHVCWEDQGGPRETALYRVVNEETGGATNWYEVPDPRFTGEEMSLLERFLDARQASTAVE